MLDQQPKSQMIKRLCWALIVPAVAIFYHLSDQANPHMHELTTVFDKAMPFNRFFILPYVYWYIFLTGALIYLAFVNMKRYYQLIISLVSGSLLCDLTFYLYPTVMIRPVINGGDWLDGMVKTIYTLDQPYNCFPSIHVVYSVLIALFIFAHSKNRALRIFTFISSLLISISTVYVKQHYFLDVVSGTILAYFLYFFYTNDHIWDCLSSLFPAFKKGSGKINSKQNVEPSL